MAVLHPERFKEAEPAGFDGKFDWDFLLPAFEGTKITPMDIDGVVERKGRFLMFETKAPGKEIPLGQKITLEQLVLIGGGRINIMFISGKNIPDINGMSEWYFSQKHKRILKIPREGIKKCDYRYVLDRVIKWFEWANKKEA